MMLGQKKQQEGEGQGWLTTFGDMVTLLFTFFVLVYSFCSYQPGKWESAVHSIKGALAVIPGTKGNRVIPGGGTGPFPGHAGVVPLFADVGQLEEVSRKPIHERVKRIREGMAGEEGVEVEATGAGVVFRIETPILFDLASAEVKPSAMDLLRKIARIATDEKATVIVSGHTCDLPISTSEFKSNWELSARRATNVLRMLQQQAGEGVKFAALARAQYDPLVPNVDEASRRQNRRVEIELDLTGRLAFGN